MATAAGLARTVVEGVELDEVARVIVVAVRPARRRSRRCGRCGRRRATTEGKGAGAGGRSMSASCAVISRPMLPGCAVDLTGWSRPRFRGHDTARVTPGLRRPSGLAGGAVLEDGSGRAHEDRLAQRWGDRHKGSGRHRRQGRPTGGAAPHRHRRDQLQARPQLLDRRCRTRLGSARLGSSRS